MRSLVVRGNSAPNTHQLLKRSLAGAELFVLFVSDLFGCISFILSILLMPIERNSANDVHYYTGQGSVSHRPKQTTRFFNFIKKTPGTGSFIQLTRVICS